MNPVHTLRFHRLRRMLALLLSWVLMINMLWLNIQPVYGAEVISDRLPQCSGIHESTLRVELSHLIQDYLSNQSDFNVADLVNRQWRTLSINTIFDTEVDQAITAVTNDTGLVNRFKSSWLPNQAQILADQVTESTFKSAGLNQKFDQLSQNVAHELADQLELISAQSSSYAMDCLQRFISRQYSQAFVSTFGNKIQTARSGAIPVPDAFDASTQSFLKTHAFAFGGAAVFAVAGVTRQVIGKQIIGRVTQQIVERIAGRLGTSAIPFVGEVIGGVMLTRDVINSFDGALPEIQTALKAPDVKAKLQDNITHQIDDELRNESYQIAREISNDIYAEWLDFQKDYRDTLNLAASLPEFKELLTREEDVTKISALVGIALNNMGRSQLIDAIQSGDFERSLSLPELTYSMLETTHDLHTLIAWTNLAGNQVNQVVRLELYKHLSPQDLDRKLLLEILSVADDALIAKLSLLDIDSIRRLLTIAKPNLIALSLHLSPDDLKRLANYLGNLEQPEVNELVRFLMADPSQLQSSGIEYLIQSHDLKAAIQFWNEPLSFSAIADGIFKVIIGQITWKLFVAKYGLPFSLLVLSVPGLILCALLLTLLRQALKRPNPAVKPSPEQSSS